MLAGCLSKAGKIVSVLLVLMMSVGFVACLSDAAPLDHVYISSAGHDGASPTHTTLEHHCLINVLPTTILRVFLQVST